MKTSSKKVAAILAVVFIFGLFAATVYSRSFAERQKPLVRIGFAQSGTIYWEFHTTSILEPATPEFEALGAEWIVEFIIPYESFREYVEQPPSLNVTGMTDMTGVPERMTMLRRARLECGGFAYVYKYESPQRRLHDRPIWPGETVYIHARPHEFHLTFDNLLPASAIHYCPITGSDFVFTVTRRQGAWGREYVANRVDVTIFWTIPRIGDMVSLIFFLPEDPVIFSSERPIFDGSLVRIFD